MTKPSAEETAAAVELGDRLRALREQAGRTYESLAAEFDPPWPDRVMDWETGYHEPTLKVLRRYTELFGGTVADLLEGVM
jgi:transcriptional regulator with XRE-family HTH domain